MMCLLFCSVKKRFFRAFSKSAMSLPRLWPRIELVLNAR